MRNAFKTWNASSNRAAILASAILSFVAPFSRADALLSSSFSLSTSSSGPFNLVSGMASGVTATSQGGQHILVMKDNRLYSWGNNTFGQLGNGTNTNSAVPLPVPGMESGVSAIASGSGHNLAIHNGALKSWGWNSVGALGNGTSNNSNVPVSVIGMESGVTAISGGFHFSLALKDGSLYAWGAGVSGMLGNGANLDSTVPVTVTGMRSGVSRIATGSMHSLAIQNGALKAWGSNDYGQLGIGEFSTSNNYRNVPTSVLGMESGVTAIAAGVNTSLAIKDGNVYVWGITDSAISYDAPLLLLDHEADFVDVSARRTSNAAAGAALSSDGSIWTWERAWHPTLPVSLTHVLPPQGYKFTGIDGGFNLQTLATIAPQTKYGDANLDSTVGFDDLLTLAQHYETAAGATWTDGDFNLDAAIKFSDLLILAQNYGSAGVGNIPDASGRFHQDWPLVLSIVPEPASISLLSVGCALRLRRRQQVSQARGSRAGVGVMQRRLADEASRRRGKSLPMTHAPGPCE